MKERNLRETRTRTKKGLKNDKGKNRKRKEQTIEW